jgi:hypothetical protein
MKFTHPKIILLAVIAFVGNISASAQSNSNVPGDTDYAKFASFVTDRNIFDPNRYLHNSRSTQTAKTRTRTRTRSAGTPFIALVGTMNYEKGQFAFFNANDSDMKQILVTGDELAGYTVKEITATTVTLADKDKKESVMKLGDQLHQDGNAWKLEGDASPGAPAESAPASENESPAAATVETPASANIEGNDVLKRLMEKRAKENQ